MLVTVKKSDALPAIQLAASIADRKGTLPILANVLLRTEPTGTMLIAATDLNVTVMASVPATVHKDGDITTAAKSFADVMKSLPGADVRLARGENNYVEITAGKSNFKIVGLAGKDFPKVPTSGGSWAAVKAAVLADALKRVFFSISTDATRAHFSGACIESEATVSTDGHRLSRFAVNLPIAGNGTYILIPRDACSKILQLVDGADEVNVATTKQYIFVKSGPITIAAKLLEMNFPPYDQVVPKESERTVTLNRTDFVDAVQRIRLMSADSTQGVSLTFSGSDLRIAADNPDRGAASEEIEAEAAGSSHPLTIGLNSAYLLNWLESAGSEKVRIGLNGALDPIKLDADSYMGVIMPMRL